MEYIIIFVILALIFLFYLKFEDKNLEITHYTVRSANLPKSFSGTNFVVIADLHNNSFGDNNNILIEEIDKINPSFIIIAGDMVVGRKSEDFSVALSLLSRLAFRYPIYYGFGNHEQRLIPEGKYYNLNWDKYIEKLRDLNIHILDNDSIKIKKDNDSLVISGISIDLKFFNKPKVPVMEEDYLEKLIGKLDKKCYNIVIGHNPIYFKQYLNINADLILSGHMHGGIVRLPLLGGVISPQYELFPKYDAGMFQEDNQIMLVSRGLGTHTIKLRVYNRPELMLVTLKN